jgi:hypothetical protein
MNAVKFTGHPCIYVAGVNGFQVADTDIKPVNDFVNAACFK